jgi:antitoxin YefM
MTAVPLDTASKSLAQLLAQVTATREPVVITSEEGKLGILVAVESFENQDATAYLTSNRANARHLEESIQQLQEGKVISFEADEFLASRE